MLHPEDDLAAGGYGPDNPLGRLRVSVRIRQQGPVDPGHQVRQSVVLAGSQQALRMLEVPDAREGPINLDRSEHLEQAGDLADQALARTLVHRRRFQPLRALLEGTPRVGPQLPDTVENVRLSRIRHWHHPVRWGPGIICPAPRRCNFATAVGQPECVMDGTPRRRSGA